MSSAPNEHPPAQAWQQRWDAVRSNTADNGAKRIIDLAHNTLDIESQAILGMKKTIGRSFVLAVRILLQATGRVVVMGMGKSGHIGRKIAATLASTGTPSFFVHPAEASHGDLGMVTPEDICLMISNSGETSELGDLIAHCLRFSIPIIGISKRSDSTLMRAATLSTNREVLAARDATDVLVLPNVDHIDIRDWKAFESGADAGFLATEKVLAGLERAVVELRRAKA
jgi:D-arabinose 5-phosphate isomerase GutQ